MHLNKLLYKFNSFFLFCGFVSSHVDNCMFICTYEPTKLILIVYVDDIILVGSSSFVIHNSISLLSKQFM